MKQEKKTQSEDCNEPMFVNLHSHSTFSNLDAVAKVEDIVNFNVRHGLPYACLTEHGTLSSAYSLVEECKKANIMPILGIEAYYVDDLTSEESQVKYNYSHIVILCKNETGWKNLKRIQFLAWQDGFLAKPRVTWEMLEKYHEGLIISSACIGGILNQPMFDDRMKLIYPKLSKRQAIVDSRVRKFLKVFSNDFWGEVMLNDLPDQAKCNKHVIELSKRFKFDVIVTNDTHYVKKEDSLLHDVVKCIAFKKPIGEANNGTYDTKMLYYVTEKSLEKFRCKYHSYISEQQLKLYMKNTIKIASQVESFEIRTKMSALPEFAGSREEAKTMLRDLCDSGIRSRFGRNEFSQVYKVRLDYELSVINKLGMADYMLIVWDIAREAREKNIPFSTRGSVAGSLVAYLIGISWIDPIKFDIIFERFLTEDRLSLPDIDMDFSSVRRMELVQYLREKYGTTNVAHIVNFGLFHPKTALKDVSKAYGISFTESNNMTKSIQGNITKWEEIPNTTEVNNFKEKYPEVWSIAERMLDLNKSRGVHASGVVLTPKNNMFWTPVAWSLIDEDKKVKDRVTEFDMYALEELGILKLDFLGQTTLDVIQMTLKNIVKFKDKSLSTLDDLFKKIMENLDDKEVFKQIQEGNLVGMFQLGTSKGMRELVMQMKCQNLEDINICITLYRTAILEVGAHVKYIARRFKREKITYIHPKMADVLKETNGIMLYQEQCLSGDTLIKTSDGDKTIKKIVDEKLNLEVYSVNTETGELELKPITNYFNNGVRELFEIELDNGYKIKCTEEHKLLTQRGWVKVKELEENDDIITV